MQQNSNIDCIAIRKLKGIDSKAYGSNYLFPIKEDFFYKRYDENKELMGLFTFDSGINQIKPIKNGYVGSYLYDSERGVIVGNDKNLRIVIVNKQRNIVFKTPLTDDDYGVVQTMAENSYFSRLTILKKVYSFFGIDGSSILLDRKSKKVLIRAKCMELNFMTYTNVINIQGFSILMELESLISEAERLAMFPETGQYMGNQYVVETFQ